MLRIEYIINIIGIEILPSDENEDGPRSEVKAIPAAKENGTCEQRQRGGNKKKRQLGGVSQINGVLRLETDVHKIRAHLYSTMILISSRIQKFRQKWQGIEG